MAKKMTRDEAAERWRRMMDTVPFDVRELKRQEMLARFSDVIVNALWRNGVISLNELTHMRDDEILYLYQVGPTHLGAIRQQCPYTPPDEGWREHADMLALVGG